MVFYVNGNGLLQLNAQDELSARIEAAESSGDLHQSEYAGLQGLIGIDGLLTKVDAP